MTEPVVAALCAACNTDMCIADSILLYQEFDVWSRGEKGVAL